MSNPTAEQRMHAVRDYYTVWCGRRVRDDMRMSSQLERITCKQCIRAYKKARHP